MADGKTKFNTEVPRGADPIIEEINSPLIEGALRLRGRRSGRRGEGESLAEDPLRSGPDEGMAEKSGKKTDQKFQLKEDEPDEGYYVGDGDKASF